MLAAMGRLLNRLIWGLQPGRLVLALFEAGERVLAVGRNVHAAAMLLLPCTGTQFPLRQSLLRELHDMTSSMSDLLSIITLIVSCAAMAPARGMTLMCTDAAQRLLHPRNLEHQQAAQVAHL